MSRSAQLTTDSLDDIEVYTEKEIELLDKYKEFSGYRFEDDEIYQIMQRFKNNDDQIKEELKCMIKDLSKGDEYQWHLPKKVNKVKKAEKERKNNTEIEVENVKKNNYKPENKNYYDNRYRNNYYNNNYYRKGYNAYNNYNNYYYGKNRYYNNSNNYNYNYNYGYNDKRSNVIAVELGENDFYQKPANSEMPKEEIKPIIEEVKPIIEPKMEEEKPIIEPKIEEVKPVIEPKIEDKPKIEEEKPIIEEKKVMPLRAIKRPQQVNKEEPIKEVHKPMIEEKPVIEAPKKSPLSITSASIPNSIFYPSTTKEVPVLEISHSNDISIIGESKPVATQKPELKIEKTFEKELDKKETMPTNKPFTRDPNMNDFKGYIPMYIPPYYQNYYNNLHSMNQMDKPGSPNSNQDFPNYGFPMYPPMWNYPPNFFPPYTNSGNMTQQNFQMGNQK